MNKEVIWKLFDNWNETLIWSCLQGIMGEIHTSSAEDAAMTILGDFYPLCYQKGAWRI